MFKRLPMPTDDLLTHVAVENLTVTETPGPSDAPPTRFGATQIVLEPDPEQSKIVIVELPRQAGGFDYVIFINRMIDSNNVYYAELITLLATLTTASSVVINIGSPGGSLSTGAIIANAVQHCKACVTTVAFGVVASAAALIWSYGHIRHVADGAAVMFHMSSHFDYGNSEEIRLRAESLVLYVKEIAIDPLVRQGILTPEEAEIIVDKRRDLWLDSTVLNARLEKFNVIA